MTDRFYGAAFNATSIGGVLAQGTTTSRPVEVRIAFDATGNSKTGVLIALKAIEHAITTGKWPPVG